MNPLQLTLRFIPASVAARTVGSCIVGLIGLWMLGSDMAVGGDVDTLPPLTNEVAPRNFADMWHGFDPRAEPLDVETLREWEEDGVVLRIVRFRIGSFKGQKATLAGVYGFPHNATAEGDKLPGLVQIHGGGQYADYRACLLNAKRGYATVSIAWAGRISAPEYRVSPAEVKLFWDGKTDDPHYKLTTDWGLLDGYHAPGRNAGNVFPSAKPAAWTLDSVESPRNSGWFLGALAARRALTFLEQQREVDPNRLGVYGHSMGGKLTVMTASDSRVKAAAPSCGGISDRDNDSPLFRATLGDDVSLRQLSCPIIFLSPANDFHGRIGDLPNAIGEIQSQQWRATCSPHHNHQDTAEYEVATLLWFDQHLKGTFEFPKTPDARLLLDGDEGVPVLTVRPDASRPALAVDVFYTQHGQPNETSKDRDITVHRFWHHADATEMNGVWTARLPLGTTDQPLWVYANVAYRLDKPVTGAGYYYGTYTARSFNVSSQLQTATAVELQAAGVRATREPSLLIEDFAANWEKEWFTYKPDEWARATHKIFDDTWKAPANATLALQVQAAEANKLVVLIDEHAAEVSLQGGEAWQEVVVTREDLRNLAGEPLPSWEHIKQLKLSPAERLSPSRGDPSEARTVGQNWRGPAPRFRNLRWQVAKDVPSRAHGRTRPNILFIAVDDLNDWIGCLGGHPQSKTPNIDRLAASGVLFTNAHCAAPACNPSRTAIMTGRSPHMSGLYDNRQKMREVLPDAELLPKYLSRHGYWSAGSGKILHYFIDAASWDEYFPAKETEDPFPRTLMPKARPVSLPRGGPWQYVETDWGALDATDEEYGGDWLVSKWIGDQLTAKHDQPFFLACGIYRPHEPWFVPRKYFDLFPVDEIQLPPGYKVDDLDDLPPAGQKRGPNRYFAHIQKHQQWKPAVQAYLASIAFADAMIGRVLDALDESPYRDNTVVVLWSDHGWHLGEKQHWQKYTAWRVCSRVPLIARVPAGTLGLPLGTKAGTVCSRPVNLLSLFPTLTELAGLPAQPENDGPSLVPLLANPNAEWPYVSMTYLGEPGSYGLSAEDWRLIHYTSGDEELYDSRTDPFEWHNLAAKPAYAERLQELRQLAPTEFAPLVAASDESLTKLAWHAVADGPAPPSKPDGDPFDVVFINRRSDSVKLFWMDGAGERKPYGEIAAGDRRRQQTRPGAVWLITDIDDKPLGHFIVEDRTAQAAIPAN